MSIKCCICGRQDVALFRQNEKGVKGVFACLVHNKVVLSEDVFKITKSIQNGG